MSLLSWVLDSVDDDDDDEAGQQSDGWRPEGAGWHRIEDCSAPAWIRRIYTIPTSEELAARQ